MRVFRTLTIAAALGMLGAPAVAQQQGRQAERDQRWTQDRQPPSPQGQAQQRPYRVLGELVDTSVNLDGFGERHVLAKIRVDGGRTIVPDLGPEAVRAPASGADSASRRRAGAARSTTGRCLSRTGPSATAA